MKKTIVYSILIVFIFNLSQILAANTPKKIIQFAENTEIYDVDMSKHYISVLVKQQNTLQFSAYLYDRNGDIKFEYASAEKYIVKAAGIDQYSYFLVVTRGSTAPLEDSHTPDIIQVFDTKTRKLVWETKSFSISYELSPDRKWLVTTRPLGPDGIELINMVDGSKRSLNIYCSQALFFDNENILVAFQRSTENKNYVDSLNRLYSEYRETGDEKVSLDFRYHRKNLAGSISKNDYDQQRKRLSAKEDSIDSIIRDLENKTVKDESGKIVAIVPRSQNDRWIRNTVKIAIYNIINGTSILEKDLYDNNGNKIFISPDSEVGKINIDSEGNIYVYGNLGTNKPRIRSLLKFNKSFILQWQKIFENSSLKKLIYNNNIYFLERQNDQINIINNGNGESGNLSDFINQHPDIQISDIYQNINENTFKFLSNLKIDWKNSAISIIND